MFRQARRDGADQSGGETASSSKAIRERMVGLLSPSSVERRMVSAIDWTRFRLTGEGSAESARFVAAVMRAILSGANEA
jgi:hypothetical protein